MKIVIGRNKPNETSDMKIIYELNKRQYIDSESESILNGTINAN